MNRRRFAALVLGTTLLAAFLLWVSTILTLQFRPYFGDPEAERKLWAAQQASLARLDDSQQARPLAVALGSSRVAYGCQPEAWESSPEFAQCAAAPSGRAPALVNLALVGAGPILQRLMYDRLRRTKVRPRWVFVEYWPAFLHQEGPYHEAARIDPMRLTAADLSVLQPYHPDAQRLSQQVKSQAWRPWASAREAFMLRYFPRWVPSSRRTDSHWARLTPTGALPAREQVLPHEAELALAQQALYYRPLFANFQVSLVADQALQELVRQIQADGAQPILVYWPEAETFRAWQPPQAQAAMAHYEAHLRATLGIPFWDFRQDLPDADLPDGFHPLAPAARRQTIRLMTRLAHVYLGNPS